MGARPGGTELDHTCRCRPCVNPAHFELVSRSENCKRINSRYRKLYVLQCGEGHDLMDYGIFTTQGGRVCAICSEIIDL